MKKRTHVALGLVATVLTVVTPAWASFRAGSGEERIVFQSTRHGGANEIYTMRPDATDIRRLTWNDATERLPRYSHDGSRIVFTRNADVWVMDADGTDERQLTSGPVFDEAPVFKRGGEQIVFERHLGAGTACPCGIWIVDADGGEPRALDLGPGDEINPDVGESGKLAFASNRDGPWGIFVARLHGGHGQRLTVGPPAFGDFRPRWAPRGNRLVFLRDDGTNNTDIWVVRADGTGSSQVTSGERLDEHAGWSPDGGRIVFAVIAVGGPAARLLTIRPDGSDQRLIPQAADVTDGFDGPMLDSSKWWQNLTGPGSVLAVTGGRVEMSLAPDATNGPSGFMGPVFGSQCRAVGDYDARVRYELLDWPFSNGVHALLGDAGTTGSIARRSESGFEDYLAFFNPVPASALTTHVAGELRLVRTGATLTAYFREGDGWVPLLTGPTTTAPTFLAGSLFSNDAIFGNAFVRVAYDDFRITADGFACPTFWRDAGPDWSAVR